MVAQGMSCGFYCRLLLKVCILTKILLVNISLICRENEGKEECGSTGSVLWVLLQTFSLEYVLNF